MIGEKASDMIKNAWPWNKEDEVKSAANEVKKKKASGNKKKAEKL